MEIVPILLLWQIPAFVCLGVYHQVWKYASMDDVVTIVKAIALATLLTSATIYALGRLPLPISVLILHAILGIGFLAGMRLARHYVKRKIAGAKTGPCKKIVIYGANAEGELLVRRIFANLGPPGNPIGFLDADPARRGGKIHGLDVLGDSYDLPLLKELYSIDEIYITPDENSNGDLQHLLRLCDQLQLKFQFVATTFSKDMNGAAIPQSGISNHHPEVHAT
jgi:FlaA1/EpsC-like NDP-sugar epimerase